MADKNREFKLVGVGSASSQEKLKSLLFLLCKMHGAV